MIDEVVAVLERNHPLKQTISGVSVASIEGKATLKFWLVAPGRNLGDAALACFSSVPIDIVLR